MLKMERDRFEALKKYAGAQDIVISTPRIVLHRDVDDTGLAHIIDTFKAFDEMQA